MGLCGGGGSVSSRWGSLSSGFVQLKHFSAITGISPCLRKVALKLKLRKVIELQGDQLIIKTLSILRNYTLSFRVGQEFEEFTQGLDKRHVKVRMNGREA